MHTILHTIATDSINRYGYCIAVSGLEDALFQSCIEGRPSNFNHDFLRPVGWSVPLGLYFEPKLTRWVGHYFIPETEKETQHIQRLRKNAFITRHREACDPYLPSFKPLIEDFLDGSELFFDAGCVCCIQHGIVQKIFPEIADNKDKNGLIFLADLLKYFTYAGRGIFKHKNKELALLAHPFFRRSLSRHNTFHWHFLDEFVLLEDLPDVNLRLAIDWAAIGFSPSINHIEELDYWHGPKFSDGITTIKPGITHHESSDIQRRLSGISRTEFYWKQDDSGYVFEAEELKDLPTSGKEGDNYGCRYVHSIFDKGRNCFDHFDGAIRMYNEEAMIERLEQNFIQAGRNSDYTKIFRLDGALPLDRWKNLIHNYFQGNPLIEEYFGILNEPKFKQSEKKIEVAPSLKDVVPYSMKAGQGIRLLVSYHSQRKSAKRRRAIVAFDEISFGEEKFDSIEYDVVELRKALQNLGENLSIPSKVFLIKSQDLYWNIPMIFHGGESPIESLQLTIKALTSVCSYFVEQGTDVVLSSTCSLNTFDREVRISVVGHVNDFLIWLQKNQMIPLSNREEFKDWLEKQAAMQQRFKPDSRDFNETNIIKNDGVLYLTRVPISEKISYEISTDDEGIRFHFKFPQSWEWVADAMEKDQLKPVISYQITKGICTRTKKDYLKSPYSRLRGETQLCIQEGKLTGVHWTDRPYSW